MKHIRILILFIAIIPVSAFAQKFMTAGPPIRGYFYMDTTDPEKFSDYKGLRCIDIVSDYNVVVTSGQGRVIFCNPHSDRTYEIGIKYASGIMVYTNIIRRNVMTRQTVPANSVVGEIRLNPKDKKFHLGLQVWQGGSAGRTLWSTDLIKYLNGYPASDEPASQVGAD